MRGRIGLLGHAPLLYRDLSGRENLAFHARLHGVALERAWELLERVGLTARADDKVHTYSRGMVQRLAVCRAVLHDPEVLLLDEPRANLDPAAAELVEPLIGASSGRTRIVTSHDPAGGLAEADLALGLRAGRADLVAPARRDRRRAHRGAVPVRRTVGAVLRKELRLELRAPQAVPAMALFSVTTLVVFHFALQRGQVDGDLAAGVLWVTLLFAAMLGTSRLFVADHEEGGLDGFLLAPVDRTALLVAKALALLGFLAAVEVVAVPAFALLLLGPTPDAGAVASLVARPAPRGCRHRGGRHARQRPRGADPRARPAGAAAGAAAPDSGGHRGREGDHAALPGRWRRGAPRALAGRPRPL